MNRVIRRGVFETNSSSVHSLTVCAKEDYDRWVNGEMVRDTNDNKIVEITTNLSRKPTALAVG